MNWRDHIIINDAVLSGKPVVKGTRLSVDHIVTLLASGWNEQQILENHPRLTKEGLQAVFAFIQDCLQDVLYFNEPEKLSNEASG